MRVVTASRLRRSGGRARSRALSPLGGGSGTVAAARAATKALMVKAAATTPRVATEARVRAGPAAPRAVLAQTTAGATSPRATPSMSRATSSTPPPRSRWPCRDRSRWSWSAFTGVVPSTATSASDGAVPLVQPGGSAGDGVKHRLSWLDETLADRPPGWLMRRTDEGFVIDCGDGLRRYFERGVDDRRYCSPPSSTSISTS